LRLLLLLPPPPPPPVSLSSFLATYSSISRPPPLLLLSLNALPSPSFLVLTEPPLQFSTISSRLQDSIDEDTLDNLPLSLVSPPKKNEEKTGRNTEKDIQFFFLHSFSAPTHSSSIFLQLRLCNNLLREMLARSTSIATSRSVPLVRSSAAVYLQAERTKGGRRSPE
jgi:hypothetical protein